MAGACHRLAPRAFAGTTSRVCARRGRARRDRARILGCAHTSSGHTSGTLIGCAEPTGSWSPPAVERLPGQPLAASPLSTDCLSAPRRRLRVPGPHRQYRSCPYLSWCASIAVAERAECNTTPSDHRDAAHPCERMRGAGRCPKGGHEASPKTTVWLRELTAAGSRGSRIELQGSCLKCTCAR